MNPLENDLKSAELNRLRQYVLDAVEYPLHDGLEKYLAAGIHDHIAYMLLYALLIDLAADYWQAAGGNVEALYALLPEPPEGAALS